MPTFKEIFSDLVAKHGGNKSEIARKLGAPVTSQQIGQYVSGKMLPKKAFTDRWKEVYGEDIWAMAEGKVSKSDEQPDTIFNEWYRATVDRLILDKDAVLADFKSFYTSERKNWLDDKRWLQKQVEDLTSKLGTQ